MSIDILMPALSPTMEEGTLSKWLVKEGDKVESGDLIAEIETDKATMEVEAIDEGVIGKILVDEGQESIKVNVPIAILLLEDEELTDLTNKAVYVYLNGKQLVHGTDYTFTTQGFLQITATLALKDTIEIFE